ncbi:Succinyl-CoA ligase [ADP-forming] subunit alpha [Paraliobacillus sp. PM-2]|uniref:acyl-CoA synthetase FdrA n=1 Tax=Paraliobacillus sp. PM-2 TaxID=1462524 RepID=UPI00061C30F0|nr:acyl-CoA synthetase FdrA [Paraliobacillus sp. PM-2]CQR47299.1 Succinyl-CoA ligase [ADP-forming] subunit alpha [Paraliobacillus sp. PM-2]
MASKVIIEKNAYHDSVTLMSLSGKILNKEGVEEAVVSMATQMNKELLENIGLMTDEVSDATENDLIIAVKAESDDVVEETIAYIDEALNAKKQKKSKNGNEPVKTFNGAMNAVPDANMAIISVPGEYAAREARQALNNGLHVMLFSDNVSIEDEKSLKELGRQKGLFVMGPDCGTAIVNHAGLCFANQVKQGGIGLVAASGTGLQEVSVQIDRMGYGITQAIGTGGRDLHEDIGGIMMLEGLKALDEDEQTKVITLISKPPAKAVQDKILAEIKNISKPVVVGFLDGDREAVESVGATFAATLIEAARQSVKLLKPEAEITAALDQESINWTNNEISKLTKEQSYVRGLFCGGTLTSEALSILRSMGEKVKSNVAKKAEEKIADIDISEGHSLLDMGDDDFTKGKPHPMIEPSLRNDRILQEAKDPETAVLLLDFELGYGSHEDPVGESIETIKEAIKTAEDAGRHLSVVAYICGTFTDKQGYQSQEEKLRDAGVFVASSNEMASKLACVIAKKEVM